MWAVREAIDADLRAVARHMRAMDALEIFALTGNSPLDGLTRSVECTPGARTLVLDGDPAAIYGAAPVADGIGVPWLLGTNAIAESSRDFVAFSREEFPRLIEPYQYLENCVHRDNEASKRWLSWLGFTLEDPAPAGVAGELFHRFWMRKHHV